MAKGLQCAFHGTDVRQYKLERLSIAEKGRPYNCIVATMQSWRRKLLRQSVSERAVESYHLQELKIANTPSDPQWVLPQISAEYKRILDVGCGAGQTLIACGVDGPGAWGVDVSLEALRLGKRLSGKTNFILAAGEALPFPDNYFDFAISRVALPYMRVVDAVSEMGRVLRPGGSLWLTLHEVGYTKRQLLSRLRKANFPGLIFQLYVLGNGVLLHLLARQVNFPFTSRCESFQTSKSMRRILLKAGFDNIYIEKGHHFLATAHKVQHATSLQLLRNTA